MREAGRGGKIGLAPLLVQRHAGRHFAQLLKLGDPEVFIQVQIAVVALRGAGVVAEEVQARAVAERHRIALQLYVHLFSELNDVLFENVRLRLTR